MSTPTYDLSRPENQQLQRAICAVSDLAGSSADPAELAYCRMAQEALWRLAFERMQVRYPTDMEMVRASGGTPPQRV